MSTLERLHTDITNRLGELREAVEEHEALGAILAQWDAIVPSTNGSHTPAGRQGRAANGRRTRTERAHATSATSIPAAAAIPAATAEVAAPGPPARRRARAASKRAPRGANQAAVREALAASTNPQTPAELAAATSIKAPVVYRVLDELVKKGEAVKHDLGNHRFAYTGTASPAAPGATGTADAEVS